MPPSHRMRGATAVLVRHKPQWHRHDRRSSAVVPSLIAVAPPKTVKTADLRGGTAETFNMFRRASAVLPPSHRRRGATAVLVRHKPQWHRHGPAVIQSLIAVAPPKTVKTADLRGGTAETCNIIFKTSAVSSRVGPIRRGTAMTAVTPYKDRSSTSITAVPPKQHLRHRRASAVQSRKCRLATLRRSRGGSTAVTCVTGGRKLLKVTGGVTTVMAVFKTVVAPRLRCDGV